MTGCAASDGPQIAPILYVAVDATGNVYVVDFSNHRIQVFAPDKAP